MNQFHSIIQSKASLLNEGDIFKWGYDVWDGLERFHSIHLHPDKHHQSNIWLLSPFSDRGFRGMFTWRDELDPIVYIPKFLLCEWKRLKGKPCIPHGNNRNVFNYQLNEINISSEYCISNTNY